MEDNLTSALIMAFSLIVFIIALSITMYMFSQVTATSEILVANADTTKYYDNIQLVYDDETPSTNQLQEPVLKGKERIVDSNTVIPTLYRYYKENFCVKIYDATRNKDGRNRLTSNDKNASDEPARLVHIFDLALENDVFKAKSFNKSDTDLYSASASEKSEAKKKKVLKEVYCSEPSSKGDWFKYNLNQRLCMYGAVWGSDNKYIKQRVDFFVNGTSGYINGSYVDFENNPLAVALMRNQNGVPDYYFTEQFISYTYTGESIETEEGDTLVTGMKPKDKIVIIYTIYDNPNGINDNPVINNK